MGYAGRQKTENKNQKKKKEYGFIKFARAKPAEYQNDTPPEINLAGLEGVSPFLTTVTDEIF